MECNFGEFRYRYLQGLRKPALVAPFFNCAPALII